jgi:hypothetical protein
MTDQCELTKKIFSNLNGLFTNPGLKIFDLSIMRRSIMDHFQPSHGTEQLFADERDETITSFMLRARGDLHIFLMTLHGSDQSSIQHRAFLSRGNDSLGDKYARFTLK